MDGDTPVERERNWLEYYVYLLLSYVYWTLHLSNGMVHSVELAHTLRGPSEMMTTIQTVTRGVDEPMAMPSDFQYGRTIGSNVANMFDSSATNGVAPPAAPTRASPAPVPNGKAPSPQVEMPQSVASSDPKIAAQQASDMRNIVRRKLTGYVGFANLPNQWHRKSVRKGFNFNVMVVGMYSLLLDQYVTDG